MNTEPLFSDQWHSVRELTPRLASDTVIHRHRYRGQTCYILHRSTAHGYHRISAQTFKLLSQLDGVRTVDAVWHNALSMFGADAPSQQEVISLLAELHEAELLVVNVKLNAEQLFRREQTRSRSEHAARFLNPLYLRFSLFDPDALLNRLLPVARILFSRTTLLLWLSLLLLAVVNLAPEWHRLRQDIAGFGFFSPQIAIFSLLFYPLLKALHELAHGMAVKRLGGQVHDCGIALMVLMPMPFVDASAASTFQSKWSRILVSAAGIMTELGVAAIAALVWVSSQGVVQDIALVILLIGGLSTLLFNGNPLLKFDGYYVLADFLEIPNLADRSRLYLQQTLSALLLGIEHRTVRPVDRMEVIWLLGYAVLSGLYRFALMLGIALLLFGQFFFFGMILAAWIGVSVVLLPGVRLVRYLRQESSLYQPRAAIAAVALVTLLVTSGTLLPLPVTTVTRGIIWLPDQSFVRVDSDCVITSANVNNGDSVVENTELFQCVNQELDSRIELLQAELAELEAKRAGGNSRKRVDRELLATDIETTRARLARVQEQHARQSVTAQIAGQYIAVNSIHPVGQYFAQGDIAAYIVPAQFRTVRVAVDENVIGQMTREVSSVRLRLHSVDASGDQSYHSRIVRQTPQASRTAISALLTTEGGGELIPDPLGDGLQLRHPVFDIELEWPAEAPIVGVGNHVSVRFSHAAQPLFTRLGHAVRRTFLRES